MAIISPFTIIRSLSLFHITVAYLLLTAPRIISDQNVVFVLGEAMQLPHATSIEKPSEATAFAGVALAFLGIADLVGASMNERTALEYWLSNVPVRLLFWFVLTGYAYLFKEGGMLGPGPLQPASIGEPLQNSLVFTFGFVEIAMWSWVFSSLRQERLDLVQRRIAEQKAQADRL